MMIIAMTDIADFVVLPPLSPLLIRPGSRP